MNKYTLTSADCRANKTTICDVELKACSVTQISRMSQEYWCDKLKCLKHYGVNVHLDIS